MNTHTQSRQGYAFRLAGQARRFESLGALLLVLMLLAAPAGAAGGERQGSLRQAVQAAGPTAFDRNSKAYLERALDTLQPLATHAPGRGIHGPTVLALREDLKSAFHDVSRVHDAQSLERTLRLLQDTSTAWISGGVSDPKALGAVTDLLMQLRQVAWAAHSDARLLYGAPATRPAWVDEKAWHRGTTAFRQAEQAWEGAFQQLAQGNDQAAGRHFLNAWRKALEALASVGMHMRPGQVTDVDGDGVADQLEVRYGATPLSNDSDRDGLTDAFEIFQGGAFMMPSSADTDGDGTLDGAEDPDRDGWNNLQEQARGTDPFKPDTDGDGLNDSQEGQAGSDPLRADADEDGLDDLGERRASTLPLNPDTDGDGILDGLDVLTGVVETPQARVTITGVGDVASSVRVRSLSGSPRFDGIAGLASAVADITAGLPFSHARVELPVDPLRVPGGDVAGLRMMYFDEEAARWREVEGAQGFDTATGRFWSDTTHFTAFAVFYIPNWDDFWTIEVCGDNGEAPDFIDVALVIDSSGSMTSNDPQNLRLEGARRLVRGLLDEDRGAVVDFDDRARLLQGLTSSKAALEAAINRIDSSGGTDIGAGVRVGLTALEAGGEDRGRLMVLLTDGVGSYDGRLTERAVQSQVTIYTIGLGPSIDVGLLQNIASRTGGKFYHVLNAGGLPDVFERIKDEVGRDSDLDTLTNCEEIEGMPDVNGKLYYADSKDVDSDGDGLLDNEEMGEPLGGSPLAPRLLAVATDLSSSAPGFDEDPEALRAYVAERARSLALVGLAGAGPDEEKRRFRVLSDPMLFDTDGDGLDDGAEQVNGTPPTLADWDGDGLNDYQELVNVTQPDEVDTDGDGFSDAYEVAHLSDGMDPLLPDERMTAEEWARDFGAGLAAGDTCDTILSGWTPCKGTIPFFLGQLSGGATSFIPVVGWIIGAVADLRDAIGNTIKGEWVGAGLSLVGVIPVVGDVGKIVGRVVDFVSKFGKLEKLLRAVLRVLPKLLGSASLTALVGLQPVGPPLETLDIGTAARDLVLQVLAKVNPEGLSDVRKLGGDEFVAKLAVMGAEWKNLAVLFNRLEDSGLFTQYPRMRGFIEDMVRTTSDEALYGSGQILNLNSRVSLNAKKAALRATDTRLLTTMRNHLRGALAEHRSLELIPGDDLIKVGHVTANGPDRVLRSGGVVDVLEVKSFPDVGLSNIKKWIIKSKDPEDSAKFIYEFNGTALDNALQAAGQPRLSALAASGQLRYNLFIYNQGTALTSELAQLFNTAGSVKVAIKDFDGLEITLKLSQGWP